MVRFMMLGMVAVVLIGCTQSPYNFPQPTLTPEGNRGYSVSGYVTFTASEEEAEEAVRGLLIDACGGAVEMLMLDLERADSWAGVPHMKYEAVGECL